MKYMHVINGQGKKLLEAVYAALGKQLPRLPLNPSHFVASKSDGYLMQYEGEGSWEIVIKLAPQQAERLESIEGVTTSRCR